jgi:hypothetical protein
MAIRAEKVPRYDLPATGNWFYKLLLTHERMLNTYTAMQNKFAGINPSCPVRNPITQMIALFTPATASPVQRLRPTRTVERTVRQQDK